jgi:flagellar assembly protein FliH
LSNKIIPRGLAGTVRRADLTEFGRAQRAPAAAAAGAREDESGARAQLERVKQQAYREGLEAGRRESGRVLDQQRADLQALIGEVNELMQDFEQTLANDVLSVSLELAKTIVRQTVRVNPEVVLSVVRGAIASLPGIAEQTVIVLNPADAALLRTLADGEPALANLPWKIVEDAQMERGGCRLETPSTEVDATLETRWRRVIAALGREDPWIEITV